MEDVIKVSCSVRHRDGTVTDITDMDFILVIGRDGKGTMLCEDGILSMNDRVRMLHSLLGNSDDGEKWIKAAFAAMLAIGDGISTPGREVDFDQDMNGACVQ